MVNETEQRVGSRRALVLPAILALALVILAAAFLYFYLQRDEVVATVNGEKITRDDLYEAMYLQVGSDALEDLIMRKLLFQEGERLGLTVSDADVDAEIDKIIEENFMGEEEEFLAILDQYGVSLETVQADARLDLLVQKIARSMVDISDEAARDYFAENAEIFEIPPEVEARHILLDTEEEAWEVIELLEGGADFAELARERSQDPGTGEAGGDLGFFKPGDMLQEFEAVAFALAAGERSEPVETYAGYHVIEVLDHKEARPVAFEEVEEEVVDRMVQEKAHGEIQEMIMRLRSESEIEYHQ